MQKKQATPKDQTAKWDALPQVIQTSVVRNFLEYATFVNMTMVSKKHRQLLWTYLNLKSTWLNSFRVGLVTNYKLLVSMFAKEPQRAAEYIVARTLQDQQIRLYEPAIYTWPIMSDDFVMQKCYMDCAKTGLDHRFVEKHIPDKTQIVVHPAWSSHGVPNRIDSWRHACLDCFSYTAESQTYFRCTNCVLIRRMQKQCEFATAADPKHSTEIVIKSCDVDYDEAVMLRNNHPMRVLSTTTVQQMCTTYALLHRNFPGEITTCQPQTGNRGIWSCRTFGFLTVADLDLCADDLVVFTR